MPPLYWPKCATIAEMGIPDSESSGPGSPCSPTDLCDVMTAYVPDPQSTLPLRTYLKELLLESSDGNRQIFRAELREVDLSSGTLTPRRRDVICKVAYGQRRIEALQKEADYYNTNLLSLQGTIIPRMYGCYRGDTEDGPTAVMILEYCGVRLGDSLGLYIASIRTQAVQALLAIHRAGLTHGDFSEPNILVSRNASGGRRLVLIDFELSRQHTCPAVEQVDINNIVPYHHMPERFECSEVDVVFKEMAQIWLPGSIKVFSMVIPEEYTASVEAVLEYAGMPSDMTMEQARSAIQAELDRKAQMLARELARRRVDVELGADD
ncbi:hypothetical protein FKP32DRAFT_1598132 [Trametes sanguinea]|nr:hypothetical protein FKP32DRAFT_1598132 [Trametes sanguinea]